MSNTQEVTAPQLEKEAEKESCTNVPRIYVECSLADRKRINLYRVQNDLSGNPEVIARAMDALEAPTKP